MPIPREKRQQAADHYHPIPQDQENLKLNKTIQLLQFPPGFPGVCLLLGGRDEYSFQIRACPKRVYPKNPQNTLIYHMLHVIVSTLLSGHCWILLEWSVAELLRLRSQPILGSAESCL